MSQIIVYVLYDLWFGVFVVLWLLFIHHHSAVLIRITVMETILEQQRRYHEERERLMDAMVKEMLHKKSSVSSS
jgi:splicing factor 3A subunit 3